MTTDHERKNQHARRIVESAISELRGIGMCDEQAIALLLIQAACRMPDASAIEQTLGPLMHPGCQMN
jgi:hypothetical protein